MDDRIADTVAVDVVLSTSGFWHIAVRTSDADFIETACRRIVGRKRMAYGAIKLRKWNGKGYDEGPDIFPPVRGKRGGLIPLCSECPWLAHIGGDGCAR